LDADTILSAETGSEKVIKELGHSRERNGVRRIWSIYRSRERSSCIEEKQNPVHRVSWAEE
ncbi:hypothetical protein HAX54_001850, partial [Datura stramonium]|nr:hypothetical protein [Datura stramonium]